MKKEAMEIHFVNKSLHIDIHNNDLPHWQQNDAVMFLTCRLADSLPQSKLAEYRDLIERFDHHFNDMTGQSDDEHRKLQEQASERIQQWLDAGMGSCILRSGKEREIVSDSLKYIDGKKIHTYAYVIMPNHLHILLSPLDSTPITDTFENLKKFMTRKINKVTGRTDKIWQKYHFDTLVRSRQDFDETVMYIIQNPKHLPESDYTLYVEPEILEMLREH